MVQSGRQISETRISKGPSGIEKPFWPVVDFQAGKGRHCHPTLHKVPGTIFGSFGQTGLGTKNTYPETFGVRVLPHICCNNRLCCKTLSRGHRSRGGTNRHFIHVDPLRGIEVSSLLCCKTLKKQECTIYKFRYCFKMLSCILHT